MPPCCAPKMGAEVIQVERPGLGDLAWRYGGITLDTEDGFKVATDWVQELVRTPRTAHR
jgi:crotonobetainyl-CoA:carnitine CoA-transferase CaiB-like acyl-CoA transferase